MKINCILLIPAAALLLLSGCNKAFDPVDAGSITVEAGIGAMTKVTTDGVVSSFEEGDKIAVYAWTGSAAAVPAERVVDGMVNTLGSDGKWTPASQMRWKPGTDAHYFLGVSPVRTISDFTADAFTLTADDAVNDLLFAKRLEGLTPGTTPVALNFAHAMAKLTVNLKVRNEFGASPAVSVSVTAKSGATVNYLTQAVTATGDASALSLTAAATAPTGYAHSFSGIQVPQEGVKTITINIDGKDYIYEAGEDIPLASGHHTTLGLIIGKDKIELSGVSVSDWTAGSAVAGGEAKRDFTRVPLTFEAQTAGAQVSFTLASIVSGVQYSTDGWTWTDYVSDTPITLANVGDCVMFRGDNAGYYAGYSDRSYFSCTEACSVYGNIMSLVSSTDFATATTLTEDHAFDELFKDNSNLRSDASKVLVLPATTLSTYCYSSLFFNCTGLTSAPALPATTLNESCYENMFHNCSGLTTAPALPATTLAPACYKCMFESCTGLTTVPALPATTLANSCYNGMFYGCSGLATAPALPATTLSANCYRAMFSNCSGLTTAPALPATTLASSCYIFMFSGCTSLTTAPALPATTLASSCYDSMFSNCSGLTTAPVLPATTLAQNCYAYMFHNCSNLNSITCAATDISAVDCTYNWLFGVAATGTFLGSSEADWTNNSSSGIHDGWSYVPYVDTNPLTFEAIVAGAQVLFRILTDVATNPVYYRTWDGSAWSSWDVYVNETYVTLPQVGDKVQFKGDNATYGVWNETKQFADGSHFYFTEDCYVFGNIMSLIQSQNYDTCFSLTADNTFCELFAFTQSHLKSDPARPLFLPATTLTDRCYRTMFHNSGLTVAPVLPAKTLKTGCYSMMFANCHDLTSITCLATDLTATDCLDMWVFHVSNTGTFTTPSSTGWSSGSGGIPAGWNRVDLP